VRAPCPPESPGIVLQSRACGFTGGSLGTIYADGTRISICSGQDARVYIPKHPIRHVDNDWTDRAIFEAELVEVDPRSDVAPGWVRRWYAARYGDSGREASAITKVTATSRSLPGAAAKGESNPMSIFKRLFGGGGGASAKPEPELEVYKDFRIFPAPVAAAGGFRVAARIEKEVDGTLRTHHLIRADICESEDEAAAQATRKARMLIDQRGDRLLDE
jgi:hypothetical protein